MGVKILGKIVFLVRNHMDLLERTQKSLSTQSLDHLQWQQRFLCGNPKFVQAMTETRIVRNNHIRTCHSSLQRNPLTLLVAALQKCREVHDANTSDLELG